MIRVFLAEDHVIVRDGLKRLLAEAPEMELTGETGRGHVVLERAKTEAWDVLVLDLSLEDIGGIEVLRRLREIAPKLPVIVLSMFPEAQYAVRILKMGAAAYLSKGRSSDELLDAIRTVARGKRYVQPEVLDALVVEGEAGGKARHDRLSEREHQIFLLIGGGLAPGDIAAQLNLSSSTVSSHLTHIREKLGVRTNGEVVQYAFRAGLAGDT
jgi:DNA-binding NarL/FixJ family response regulator